MQSLKFSLPLPRENKNKKNVLNFCTSFHTFSKSMSRMQRMFFVLWLACKKVELQGGLGLRSIAKSMRQQTSSGRCSAISRSIHKRKTCSFRAGNDLSNDILVLKIDWQMTLQCLWRCRAASVFDQSWNRCVGKLRANAVQPFLARFTKARSFRRYLRFENRLKNDAGVPV